MVQRGPRRGPPRFTNPNGVYRGRPFDRNAPAGGRFVDGSESKPSASLLDLPSSSNVAASCGPAAIMGPMAKQRRVWAPLVADADELRLIQDSIGALAATGQEIQILEAGCGRKWSIPLDGLEYRLTGIDLDPEALQARVETVGDLDVAVLGDLHTVTLPEASFDAVFCSYVLEHVTDPEGVLRNFQTWLKPGGIMILRVPDRDSVYGFLSRMTPHWLHVAVYRYILGKAQAGKPGFAPYPTVYDPLVSYAGVAEYCDRNNLRLREAVGHFRFRSGIRSQLIGFVSRLVAKLSLGRLAGDHANLTFVIETPGR
jgi:SAM-dependent methyltransferase